MKKNSSSSLSLIQLLAYWRAFAQLLVLYARCVAGKQHAHAPDAWGAAEQLEICARTALAELVPEMRGCYSETPPQTEEEIDAHQWLTVVAGALMALAFFAQMLKQRLAGRGVSGVRTVLFARAFAGKPSAHIFQIPFLDSG